MVCSANAAPMAAAPRLAIAAIEPHGGGDPIRLGAHEQDQCQEGQRVEEQREAGSDRRCRSRRPWMHSDVAHGEGEQAGAEGQGHEASRPIAQGPSQAPERQRDLEGTDQRVRAGPPAAPGEKGEASAEQDHGAHREKKSQVAVPPAGARGCDFSVIHMPHHRVKSAFQRPSLTKRRALTLRLGSRWVFRRPKAGRRAGLRPGTASSHAVAVMRVPGYGASNDRRCPYDEADEVTAWPPRPGAVVPTATTLAVCATGRDPMSTVSVDGGGLVGPVLSGAAPEHSGSDHRADVVRPGDIDHLDGGGHRGGLAAIAPPSSADRDADRGRSGSRAHSTTW